MNNRVLGITIVILAILIAGSLLIYHPWKNSININKTFTGGPETSYQFNGTIKSMDGNKVTIEGMYVNSLGGSLSGGKLSIVTVLIDSNTQIVRTAIVLPQTGGQFDPSKLPSTTTKVDAKALIN